MLQKSIPLATAFLFSIPSIALAATLEPDPVLDSSLILKIEAVAQATGVSDDNNTASPVVIDGVLHVVDQTGAVLRETSSGFINVLGSPPSGVTLEPENGVLNIADGDNGEVFVALTSSTLPAGAGAAELPPDSVYQSGTTAYQLIYKYQQGSDGTLTSPTLLTALEIRDGFHNGGGMVALPDGNVLFATGDSLPFDRDGLSAPQDDDSHLSKLLIIDRDTGEVDVAAKGVRNVQRLTYDPSGTRIVLSDIGAAAAEEVNSALVADLLDTSEVENFGWGRNPDGNAREGTFYIDTARQAIGMAPIPEAGFIQPYAQFGREDMRFIAASGPIVEASTFDQIVALFGDLVSGALYATVASDLGSTVNDVFRVGLIDADGLPTTLLALSGGDRADPRFFTFADGSAGVLLERTGVLYRLTEIAPPTEIPLPAGLLLLIGALTTLGVVRSRRTT